MSLSFTSYLLLNGFFLFFISLNNVINLDLIDLTIILSLFIYAVKWSESEWLIPIFLFLWGIFQDILLGINLGHSGTIFLFFYILNKVISNYGLFEHQNIKFIIFVTALLVFLILKNLLIYLNYQINYLSISEFLSFLIIVLLYVPINTIILYSQKKYEKAK